jgi:hypothetical protein
VKNERVYTSSPHIFASHFHPQQKEPLVCTGQEDRLLAEPVWMLWRREKLVAPLKIELLFLDSLACSPATTLSYPASDYPERSHHT